MRTGSSATLCLPGLGPPLHSKISAERTHAAGIIRMLDAAEQRVASGETVIQPPPSGVCERAGAIRINSVALGKLLRIKLRHPFRRPADLIGDSAYPIFKTVVIAHPHILAGVQLGDLVKHVGGAAG